MDLTKLLSILENKALFLPRADKFNDPYEGALSRATVNLLRDPKFNTQMDPESAERFIKGFDLQRQERFISCWCAQEHESAAMWKIYLQSVEGVAIRSDYDALAAAMDRSSLAVRITMVEYIDYDRTVIPCSHGFFPFIHKRLCFEHEKELRAIVWSLEGDNKPQIPEDATSVTIDIVPEDLIKAVHVSPTAPEWFGELVEQLLRRYHLDVHVERSSLYDRPSY